MYCGDVVLISQPLLPIGVNTPSCMQGLRDCVERAEIRRDQEVMNSFHLRVR